MKMRSSQSGVMLLEALIGLLIFLIGIIGVMGLQAATAAYTIDSKYRSEASYLANQIIGKMWADIPHLSSYVVASGDACPGTVTTERERWICAVENSLPNATGTNSPTITVVGDVVTVTVRWQKDSLSTVHNHMVVATIDAS